MLGLVASDWSSARRASRDGEACARVAATARRACPRPPAGASRMRRRCRSTCASRTAVSGVIAAPAVDQLVDAPARHAERRGELGLADPSGFRKRVSRNWPGCGGVRVGTPKRSRADRASRCADDDARRGPSGCSPRLASRLVRFSLLRRLEHAEAVDHRADRALAAHDVLAEDHVHVDDRKQSAVPHRKMVHSADHLLSRRRARTPSRTRSSATSPSRTARRTARSR